MKQKIFAICDMEEAYAHRLTEYMLDKVRLPYTIHLFTRVEELQRFADQEEIEILLIAESALQRFREEYAGENVMRTFVLQESEMPMGEEYHYIGKFQSPEMIMETLFGFIADLSDWRMDMTAEDRIAKLIGVYSPVKRCLQTTFALTLGQILAKEHRTLYINFENYSGFGQLLKREFSMDMMDLMYYFRCDKDKLALRLPTVIQNIGGLDYIPPMQTYTGHGEVTGRQWLDLCRCISAIETYEYIILDLDDGMEGLFDLLQNCHRIYTITKEDSFAVAKLSQYEQILRFNALEDIAAKTVKCRFPVFKELPVDLDLMTHGEMAGYVRAIVREDLYGK